jgi:polyferredoxin
MKTLVYISVWVAFQMISFWSFAIGNLSANIREWKGDAAVGFALLFFLSSLALLIVSTVEHFDNKK